MLIHLCSGSYTINSQEEELLGLDLGEDVVHIVEDADPDLFFGNTVMGVVVVVVGAVVNNAIHIKVQVV